MKGEGLRNGINKSGRRGETDAHHHDCSDSFTGVCIRVKTYQIMCFKYV